MTFPTVLTTCWPKLGAGAFAAPACVPIVSSDKDVKVGSWTQPGCHKIPFKLYLRTACGNLTQTAEIMCKLERPDSRAATLTSNWSSFGRRRRTHLGLLASPPLAPFHAAV